MLIEAHVYSLRDTEITRKTDTSLLNFFVFFTFLITKKKTFESFRKNRVYSIWIIGRTLNQLTLYGGEQKLCPRVLKSVFIRTLKYFFFCVLLLKFLSMITEHCEQNLIQLKKTYFVYENIKVVCNKRSLSLFFLSNIQRNF